MEREDKTMDMNATSGLPIQLDGSGKLHLDPDVIVDEYKTRVLDELTPVYLDQQACHGSQVAYEMFNGVYAGKHREILQGLPVRYELTLFPEMKVGPEYVKTLGHIHLPDLRSGIDHPEICEVITGRAHFFFMKLNPDGASAAEAFFVEVCAGEKIIIPPGYEHLTINPGPGPMLFSDVVSVQVGGNYERMKSARGAAYLEVERNGLPIFIPNPQYHSVPPLLRVEVRDFPALGLTSHKPLYSVFVETRGADWEFLWRPELYQAIFPDLNAIFVF
jgi:glucose-6-phosphate isomerase, archaeal